MDEPNLEEMLYNISKENDTIGHYYRLILRGELTREEGLRMMVLELAVEVRLQKNRLIEEFNERMRPKKRE